MTNRNPIKKETKGNKPRKYDRLRCSRRETKGVTKFVTLQQLTIPSVEVVWEIEGDKLGNKAKQDPVGGKQMGINLGIMTKRNLI